MENLIEIAVNKSDYWTLGILLFSTVLLAILKLPIFTKLTANQAFTILNKILWAVSGISGLYIFTLFIKDLSKDKVTREKERMAYFLGHFDRSAKFLNQDKSYDSLFKEVSNRIIPKPVNIEVLDNSKCWIQTNQMSHLFRKPQLFPKEIVQNDIPIDIYYTLNETIDNNSKIHFFKVKLKNGLEGWIMDDGLNKNQKCYE